MCMRRTIFALTPNSAYQPGQMWAGVWIKRRPKRARGGLVQSRDSPCRGHAKSEVTHETLDFTQFAIRQQQEEESVQQGQQQAQKVRFFQAPSTVANLGNPFSTLLL